MAAIATRLPAAREADRTVVAVQKVDEGDEEQQQDDADNDADHNVLVLKRVAAQESERAMFSFMVLRPGRQRRRRRQDGGVSPDHGGWQGYSEAPGC